MNIAYIKQSYNNTIEEQKTMLSSYAINSWQEESSFVDNYHSSLGLEQVIQTIGPDDCLYVSDLSKISRSIPQLINTIRSITEKGGSLVSAKEGLEITPANAGAYLIFLGSIAEFEKTANMERQKEGIAIAKTKGVYKGRKSTHINKKLFDEYYSSYIDRHLTKMDFAKALNIARPTLDKFIKAFETQNLITLDDEYYVENSNCI